MGDLFIKLKNLFSRGNTLIKLIFINTSIFLIIRLLITFITLFQFGNFSFLDYIKVSSSLNYLFLRPWTIFTYMFVHFDLFHLFFNMLCLFGFGRIFLFFFNERQLLGLYILGGVIGSLFFIGAYNIIPYFQAKNELSYLLGASGSVMAIIFAISFFQKDYEINLLLIGKVKLIYLALITFSIDLISITSINSGGHIAHIGAALFGILFANLYHKRYDLTRFINLIIDNIALLRKHGKLHMQRAFNNISEEVYEMNIKEEKENDKVDKILDKLKYSGYDSLSLGEKKTLFDASRK